MWYAVQTEVGQEEFAKQQIGNLVPEEVWGDCKILYCIRKKRYLGQWHDERRTFLPGYLFLETRDGGHGLEILDGLWEAAENPVYKSGFFPVRREEEELLKRLTDGQDVIGMSYGVIENGILKISRGVLAGMESRVKRIDRHKRRGYIRMELDGQEKLAEIGLEITEKTCPVCSESRPRPKEGP